MEKKSNRSLCLFVWLPLLLLLNIAAQTQVPQGLAQPGVPTPAPGRVGAAVTPAPRPLPTAAASPQPTTAPAPGGVQRVIHRLLFPAETISEALTGVFAKAAEKEAESLSEQAGQWGALLGEVIQAPKQGYYQAVAESGLPVAAALAPALFLLRLVLYHWQRLVGSDDSALKAIGDWVAAGALAVAAGPFLDLMVRLGWWIAGAALGETSQLAMAFVQSTTVFSVAQAVAQVSLFSGILVIGVAVGGLLAMAGMLFAFASAQAALYVMAVLAAPVAVAGVVPQMRWLRSLWIKAVAVLGLLPVVAGGVFKAAVALGTLFAGEGLLSLLIRLLWLWGATGALLALAAILSRVTLSASVGALGQLTQGVKAIISTALLAGAAAAAGGPAAGAAGGSAAGLGGGIGGSGMDGPGGSVAGGLLGSATSGGLRPGEEPVLEHYDQAQALAQRAMTLSALGLGGPAQYARAQAHWHALAARRADLERRLARFAGIGETDDEAGRDQGQESVILDDRFSQSVLEQVQTGFAGPTEQFQQGFQELAPHLGRLGLNPHSVAQQYPEEAGRMVRAYLDHRATVMNTDNPPLEAARLGGAVTLQGILEEAGGYPNKMRITPERAADDRSNIQEPGSSAISTTLHALSTAPPENDDVPPH